MGLIKREIHSIEVNQLADGLRALAHPARLAILTRISQSDSCICTDLSKELGLAQATVSQHLRALKDANLIQGSIEGNSMCYCIEPGQVQKLATEISELMNRFLQNAPGACC